MKHFLLWLILTLHVPTNCMDLIPKTKEEQAKLVSDNFITTLHSYLKGSDDLQEYPEITKSPWYKTKIQLTLSQRCMIAITKNYLNFKRLPQDVQESLTKMTLAHNMLNGIMRLWTWDLEIANCPGTIAFPPVYGNALEQELNNHYQAITKALLNGAQPNQEDLDDTFFYLDYVHPLNAYGYDSTHRNACLKACRPMATFWGLLLTLEDVKD